MYALYISSTLYTFWSRSVLRTSCCGPKVFYICKLMLRVPEVKMRLYCKKTKLRCLQNIWVFLCPDYNLCTFLLLVTVQWAYRAFLQHTSFPVLSTIVSTAFIAENHLLVCFSKDNLFYLLLPRCPRLQRITHLRIWIRFTDIIYFHTVSSCGISLLQYLYLYSPFISTVK